MAAIDRVTVEEGRRKVQAKQALLVCAYEDDAKCRMLGLDGSLTMSEFQSKVASLAKTQEIIFYCA